MTRPLDGIRVLDFSRLLPGPYCSLLLSDMGAEVVKVEEPGRGDYARWMPPNVGGMGAAFISLNRGKKSLSLDLRSEKARNAILRLVERFDVVLESFRPGVMERLGLGYEALRQRNPRLIYCAISGYGQRGPYADKAGHDLNYIALAGVLGATGPVGGPPELPAVQVADLAGGSYPAALSIVAALFERVRTGEGRFLDISMTDGALSLMLFHLAGHLVDGKGTPPGRLLLSGGLLNYRTFKTGDGRALALGALEPRFWQAFLARVGREDLLAVMSVEDEAGQRALAELEALFLTRTRDEWVAFLQETDACCEPVLDADEVVHHPLHLMRGMVRTVDGTGGGAGTEPLRCVVGPLPFGREALLSGAAEEPVPLPTAPALGADGVALLRAHGFSEAELEALRAEGGLQ